MKKSKEKDEVVSSLVQEIAEMKKKEVKKMTKEIKQETNF